MSIFKACDIRGVVGEELDEAVAGRIGRGLGEMIRRRNAGALCLGGDYRRNTPALKQALLTGLLETGARVYDLGQVPTPVVYFAATHLGCPNVAIVTASHNAGKYNGLKFMVAGRPATPPLMRELQANLELNTGSASTGQVEPVEVLALYERQVRATAARTCGLTEEELASRHLKVVVDAMGGAFTDIAPRVLAAAGCEVIALTDTIDPDFNRRHPNPAVDDNLQALCERVAAERADLGIALDGDGDRAAFVDGSGTIIRPEQMGVLLVRECFNRPLVVYDLKCSSILAEAVRIAGGSSVMQPSGHGFIKTAMIDQGADLGVEVSGHYFFKALGGGDDGLFVSLLTACLVAKSGRTFAELIKPIGWPAITPDLRIPFKADARTTLDRIAAECGGEVFRLDGVRAQYDDGWGLARISITEPVITFRFEGRNRQSLQEVAKCFLKGVPELYAEIKERLDV